MPDNSWPAADVTAQVSAGTLRIASAALNAYLEDAQRLTRAVNALTNGDLSNPAFRAAEARTREISAARADVLRALQSVAGDPY